MTQRIRHSHQPPHGVIGGGGYIAEGIRLFDADANKLKKSIETLVA
jgi:hypothetical protein